MYEGVRGVKSDLLRVDVATGAALPLISSKNPGPDSELQRLHKLRGKMTPTGSAALANRLAGENRVVTWKNDEGQTIEGALTLPPREVAQAPYKLILLPHGGPHGRDSEFPSFTAQVFAANGYAVFRPNFRGSLGYGRKFLDGALKDIGGPDMRDMLTGIDYLVREKLVDPKRQFVYGVSYGGFTTCWLVGHTNQFRAAAAQNAVTEMNVMWGVSDLPSWKHFRMCCNTPKAWRVNGKNFFITTILSPLSWPAARASMQ
jgi:dipeptidyl aminopeptidase/acylaminoacyl peptidase